MECAITCKLCVNIRIHVHYAFIHYRFKNKPNYLCKIIIFIYYFKLICINYQTIISSESLTYHGFTIFHLKKKKKLTSF
ncbi:hypothetical protein KUTeg_009784 [Tegillarca granosa]|uniref:Uncharacterized protein n=1 Tax=Tegillarca granosa TaxID=220873 RepID=A0ABQ9F4W7_TEGGR|nr:hypothetical protein KUTeg_009784 [Tegillarca granosa]